MTLEDMACHPELVEGSRAEALPPCFDKLSMTPVFEHVVGTYEGSSSGGRFTMQGEEDASYLSMTTINFLIPHTCNVPSPTAVY